MFALIHGMAYLLKAAVHYAVISYSYNGIMWGRRIMRVHNHGPKDRRRLLTSLEAPQVAFLAL